MNNIFLYTLHVKGVVQGVGFRPFVYKTAKKNNLFGSVCNMGNMVEIKIVANELKFNSFLNDLNENIPPLARIDSVDIEKMEIQTILDIDTISSKGLVFDDFLYDDFYIIPSKKGSGADSILPQDTAICNDCLNEIKNKADRHFMYPFTVCTNCGPSYTSIRVLPYDRENTSMDEFPMCKDCLSEYTNTEDRRYHAQTSCCPKCGPVSEFYVFENDELKLVSSKYNAFKSAAEIILSGKTVAVKGYGGFHLVCNASDESAVSTLRKRLNRPNQPFALMVSDLETVKKISDISEEDENLLKNQRRPIVIFNKKYSKTSSGFKPSKDSPICNSVSPDIHNVGIMLPYSGTHFVLFEALSQISKSNSEINCLVMTSANLPGRPMVIDNNSSYEKLKGIADGFLVDNRIIENRTDDTVIRIVNSKPLFLRRSRGFVPERILLPFSSETGVAGVGAEMNNTVSLSKNGLVFISQYIGNTKHFLTNEYHIEALEKLKELSGITPELWVCDMHPSFNTTKTAENKAREIIKTKASNNISNAVSSNLLRVQHHHAHICSCMADNMLPLDSCVLGVVLDGVGFGTDGTVWGGEILKCTYTDFERLAHFKQQPMAGGDTATYFPARMVYGCLFEPLSKTGNLDDLISCKSLYFKHGEIEKKAVLSLLKREENIVKTSSAGRILDSVSSILGLCDTRTYDGEPAMKLESAAYFGRLYGTPDYNILKPEFYFESDKLIFDTSAFLLSIFNLSIKRSSDFSVYEIAAMAEQCISDAVCKLVEFARDKTKINIVALSGGVFNNNFLLSSVTKTLVKSGFTVYSHKNLPSGDGCISHGQVAVGVANLLLNKK